MKDYSNYIASDCCATNKELRYEPITSHMILSGNTSIVYKDKLTNEIIYDVDTIDLCAIISPIPEKDTLYEPLDPLKIDPLYTPSKFNKPRISSAEETKDWELVNSYDRIGNKHGRWFLNGVNLTRYDIYKLYDETNQNNE
jgi:hypothetical protein